MLLSVTLLLQGRPLFLIFIQSNIDCTLKPEIAISKNVKVLAECQFTMELFALPSNEQLKWNLLVYNIRLKVYFS